jgi:hypothetical protein
MLAIISPPNNDTLHDPMIKMLNYLKVSVKADVFENTEKHIDNAVANIAI